MYRTRYILLFWMILLLPTWAMAEYYVINDYKVDIRVLGDKGMFEVNEIITVQFSQPRHGIFRNIPVKYLLDGKENAINVYDVKVQGFKYTKTTQGSDLIIKIGDPNVYVDGIQTYHISYKVKDAFMFMEDWTEFYWNLNSNTTETTTAKLSYTIALDKSIAMEENDYFVRTGQYGSVDTNATISYYLNTFSGSTTKPLNPREGVTVGIKLPFDYIKRPTEWELWLKKYGAFSLSGFITLIMSGIFYRLWAKYGKDYPIIQAVEFQPPASITPSEAGVIIDEKADNIDIMAMLPYWAHKGLITIERIPKSRGMDDHRLKKIANLSASAPPYEQIIFMRLFTGGNSVLVSSLENNFHQYLSSARGSLKSHVESMGVYYPISIKMQVYLTIFSILLAALGIIFALIFESLPLALGFGLSGVVGLIAAANMLKKNEYGVRLYQHINGFKMFVKSAEKDRIERMLKEDPDYFEKTLPYAMIFGYAGAWSKKFDGLLTEPPKWYVTPGGHFHGGTFMPSDFGRSFDSGIREMQSAFSSVPSSSDGGGGFGGSGGGGGFSGGGFGGGGTGSW